MSDERRPLMHCTRAARVEVDLTRRLGHNGQHAAIFVLIGVGDSVDSSVGSTRWRGGRLEPQRRRGTPRCPEPIAVGSCRPSGEFADRTSRPHDGLDRHSARKDAACCVVRGSGELAAGRNEISRFTPGAVCPLADLMATMRFAASSLIINQVQRPADCARTLRPRSESWTN